jgi:hypothetical protein
VRGVSVVLAAAFALSCSGPPSQVSANPDDRKKSGLFIAIASDFRGFHSWQSYDTTDGADAGGIHDGSTVREYINQIPRSGSTEFPIGTAIVKEVTGGTMGHEMFAMVKREGPDNTIAKGWEWLDLIPVADGKDSVTIKWRGNGPPIGDTYGGDSASGCNTCHRDCGNDAVCAKELALKNF